MYHPGFQTRNASYTASCSLFQPDLDIEGRLYVIDGDLYFGYGKKWYKFELSDIADLKLSVPNRSLSITTNLFDITLRSSDLFNIISVRDFLLVLRQYRRWME